MGTPQPGAADPIIGRSLHNYRVTRKLGAGAMGSVYLLEHERVPNLRAALKVLGGDLSDPVTSTLLKERFEQEAAAAAAVGSHRVAQPMNVGRFDEDGRPYIVMEYVAGPDLSECLQQLGALPVKAALRIAIDVADTMAAAHDHGIVHRDLKPSNLKIVGQLSGAFKVKVLDFGVARASGEIKRAYTADHALIGTPGYMSPEAATAGKIDHRTDVFSLGVIVFEMLTGGLPFPHHPFQTFMLAVAQQEPPSLASRRAAQLEPVPASVQALVSRALEKNPEKRLSMLDLLRALLAEMERLEPDAGPQTLLNSEHALAFPDAADQPTVSDRSADTARLLAMARDAAAAPTAPLAEPATVRDKASAMLPGSSAPLGAVTLQGEPAVALPRPGDAVTLPGRVVAPSITASAAQRPRRHWAIVGVSVAITAMATAAVVWWVNHRPAMPPVAVMPPAAAPPGASTAAAAAPPPATAPVASPTPATPPKHVSAHGERRRHAEHRAEEIDRPVSPTATGKLDEQ